MIVQSDKSVVDMKVFVWQKVGLNGKQMYGSIFASVLEILRNFDLCLLSENATREIFLVDAGEEIL